MEDSLHLLDEQIAFVTTLLRDLKALRRKIVRFQKKVQFLQTRADCSVQYAAYMAALQVAADKLLEYQIAYTAASAAYAAWQQCNTGG